MRLIIVGVVVMSIGRPKRLRTNGHDVQRPHAAGRVACPRSRNQQRPRLFPKRGRRRMDEPSYARSARAKRRPHDASFEGGELVTGGSTWDELGAICDDAADGPSEERERDLRLHARADPGDAVRRAEHAAPRAASPAHRRVTGVVVRCEHRRPPRGTGGALQRPPVTPPRGGRALDPRP